MQRTVPADTGTVGSHGLRVAGGEAPAPPSPVGLAAEDLLEGLRLWEFWTVMRLQGVRRGYRRSVLGPFWLTLSLAVTVTALGLLYGQLFGLQPARYGPHLTRRPSTCRTARWRARWRTESLALAVGAIARDVSFLAGRPGPLRRGRRVGALSPRVRW